MHGDQAALDSELGPRGKGDGEDAHVSRVGKIDEAARPDVAERVLVKVRGRGRGRGRVRVRVRIRGRAKVKAERVLAGRHIDAARLVHLETAL